MIKNINETPEPRIISLTCPMILAKIKVIGITASEEE
tara:strand:+ start:1539 stop:1649 length:111 start_codon:yes stop_codon:yes gene_type:complete